MAARVALAGLCAGVALAQSPKPSAAVKHSIPIFTASARLVQIPVIVDHDGGPTAGLSQDDFTITDNGKSQAIRFFAATTPPAAAAAAPEATMAPPAATAGAGTAFSNAGQPHPVVVILLDQLNSTLGTEYDQGEPAYVQAGAFQFAKNQLVQFVRSLPPDDRVALYGLSRRLTLLSDFTGDRTQLLAALKSYKPASNPGAKDRITTNTDVPGGFNGQTARANGSYAARNSERTGQITMQALRTIANHVAVLPGRVSLVWLTADPAVAGATVAAALGTAKVAVYPVDSRGLLTRAGLEAKSGVDGFPLDAGQMIAWLSAQMPGQDALRDIAKETGGQAFVNTNDIAGAIATAARDSETSYILGFYVTAQSLDNSFHKITVKVRGHGLHPRYPRGYWALADSAPQRARVNAAAIAMASANDAVGIGLRATASRQGSASPAVYRLVGRVDMRPVALEDRDGLHNGVLVIALAQQNRTGAVLWRGSWQEPIHVQEGLYRQLLANGMPFELDVKAAAGVTTFRVIVVDPVSGLAGSLIIPLGQVKN